MLDLQGYALTAEEHELLDHPFVGGVILFSRNYVSREQLIDLCRAIKNRKKPLLIAVDQEGGRVQRFRAGFTVLPSMAQIGNYYEQSPELACQLAETCAWVMATELRTAGIDLSFAPVLDLQKNCCPAIGDRAFHVQPEVVTELAKAFIVGMHQAGMAATGKHFPGHGSVVLDSHIAMPVDEREFPDIEKDDLSVFVALVRAGIDALMTAHIVFKQVDDKPTCFSAHWLQQVLRKQYCFDGVIFSDDLNMQGAGIATFTDRVEMALVAGCDMVLLCNNRAGVIEVLDQLPYQRYLLRQSKCAKLCGKNVLSDLNRNPFWEQKQLLLRKYFNSSVAT
ncbi:MAG: beta-N-acetylhexosaminidase [Gammaproteobacteria bacterium RIFCSPHIGHO2_12_FULL_41_20]|nr:MAG: beta-N-acetylhexosaminidase [Gammaproteobacteria bacterium RIFCSPHIGHO2_12_FULL_41_20]